MSQLQEYLEHLKSGKDFIKFRLKGDSMTPTIKPGQLVSILSLHNNWYLQPHDVVLCVVDDRACLGKISEICWASFRQRVKRYKIIDGAGCKVGWISAADIYGRVLAVEDFIPTLSVRKRARLSNLTKLVTENP